MAHSPGYREERPWGSFEVLATGDGHEVKRLEVLPGKRLSDQRHESRDEHWTIVGGGGFVHLDDGVRSWTKALHPGKPALHIPKGTWHRLDNTGGKETLIVIETWVGLCDEADIERRNDDFGRVEQVA